MFLMEYNSKVIIPLTLAIVLIIDFILSAIKQIEFQLTNELGEGDHLRYSARTYPRHKVMQSLKRPMLNIKKKLMTQKYCREEQIRKNSSIFIDYNKTDI